MTSKIRQAVQEAVQDLHHAGLVDALTLRRFNKDALPPLHAYCPEEIRALRKRLRVSQTVFAHHLHTSTSTIRKWEIGINQPSGPALKLLNVIDRKGLEAIS